MQILSRDVPLMSEYMTILISLNEKNVCSQVEGKMQEGIHVQIVE